MPPPFLSSSRLVAWSAVFLVVETAVFALLVLQQTGVIQRIGPASIDFVSFYAAGKLALAGTPALAYDQLAHHLAEQAAREPGIPYVFFFYPPVFLFICAALATLPYIAALLLYQAATFAFLAATLRAILRPVLAPGWSWLIPVVAFPASFWNLGQGQNAFLTTALLGLSGLLLERRPATAGALIGALAFKPHLALLTPVALAAGRHWRAFTAAALTLVALVALSASVFGLDTWRAYLAAMSGAAGIYTTGRINFAGFTSVFGALRLIGIPTGPSYLLQAAAAVLAAALVWTVWSRRDARPARHAALLAATMLAVPLFLLYDQVFALLAIAWLLREAPLTPRERLVLALLYPLSLVAVPLAIGPHLPLGLAVNLAVAAICFRRALRKI